MDTFSTVEALRNEFGILRDELIIAEKSGVKLTSTDRKERFDTSKFSV